MKTISKLLASGLLLANVGSGLAVVRYVDVNSPNATPPFASWATAATNIQDAVDAAAPGDEIVVTNGIYATGERAVSGTTNRVAVDKPLNVRSVNGPQFTTIDGGHSNRCVYLTNGVSLSGFTLTNGRAVSGGGLWCASTNAVASNCVVSGNSALFSPDPVTIFPCCSRVSPAIGGGAYGGTLNSCILSNNRAETYSYFWFTCDLSTCRTDSGPGQYYYFPGSGGGAYNSTLNNCTLTGNSAGYGGGACGCTLNNCTLTGNSAPVSGDAGGSGGGASGSTLNNCMVTGNSAAFAGGGAHYSTLNNCALSGNSAYLHGGGASGGTLNNCTLTGNSAYLYGGGASDYYPRDGFSPIYFPVTLNNCVVYFNTAPQRANYSSGTLNYSCTTPQPTNGVGNISVDPQLASASHLSAASPCRGAGNGAYAGGADIDGETWASPPSIGCDEYHAGAVTGSLSVAITASFTNVLRGFTVQLTALIEGRTTASVWDFGDGVAATNKAYASHSWTALGDYPVVLRAYNESQPGGISATVTVHVVTQPVHYVAAANGNPLAPYTSWATAATNIQDAVDAATVPGALVLVSNGIYTTTPSYDAKVRIDRLLTVRSVNGPQFTVIDGGGYVRCVYLTNGACLSGFTLTNGFAIYGGGAYGGTLNNCTLTGNRAIASFGDDDGGSGGGAYNSTLNNCTLTGNSADSGGGAAGCTLNNCTLAGNPSGGAYYSTLNNCIVYFNTADYGANYDSSSTLNYCCTTPQPTDGFGNISNAPLFLDTNGWSNLRLQSGSPCINVGLNAFAPAGLDLDGNPRIVGGSVDMGAYEYQSLDLLSFGVVSNRFGFNVTGQSNWVIVLEASNDFMNWTPLTTNTFGAHSFPFSDPSPPNLPQRFYRARQR